MADQNNPHFDKIYVFCIIVFASGFIYLTAVTFLTVPKENQRIVDTISGSILTSMVGAAIGYLLGGNPTAAKKATGSDADVEQMDVSADNVNVKENA